MFKGRRAVGRGDILDSSKSSVMGTPGKQTLTEEMQDAPAIRAPVQRNVEVPVPAQQRGHSIERVFGRRNNSPVQAHGELRTSEPAHDIEGDARVAASRGNLPGALRERMEASFGANFEGVRVHEGSEARSRGALAVAQGDHLHFAPGQYQPNSASGQRLIAHELAHVVQQQNGVAMPQYAGRGDGDAALEAEADRAADAAVNGGSFEVRGAAGVHAIQRSTLSDQVRAAADKGAVFAVLRAACPVGGDSWAADALTADGDADLTRELAAKLGAMPDDVWLARQIRHYGAEPLWPVTAIEERARRANSPGSFGGRAWAPEAGNIGVQMAIPDVEKGEDKIAPIQVFFFPGRTGRRALVVGGVHGTEHQGVEVVEQLRAKLAADSAAGSPPFFSTVLVPTLIQRSDTAGRRNVCGPNSSAVPSDKNHDVAGAKCSDGSNAVEPNRTFPGAPHEGKTSWAGQSYQDAKRDGLKRADNQGKISIPPAKRMIAETRALIALIEQFQPERIASIHAHSVPGSRGDGPGIFVDPRGGVAKPNDPTRSDAKTADGRADDQLARAMLTGAEADLSGAARADGTTNPLATRPLRGDIAPLKGNQAGKGGDQVHYSASHPTGTSLGDWAPSRGITTVTVEVPQSVAGTALADIETMHCDLRQRVFLADPALATPGAFGTAPSGLQGVSNAPAPTRAP